MAASITVNTNQDVVAVDGSCSLREAITSVNKQAASGNLTGECAAGDGNDTITLPAGTFTLTIAGADEDQNVSGDLDVRASMTIAGARMGRTIVDGSGIADRVLDLPVGGISLILRDVTIENGHAPDGAAGNGETGGGINNAAGANLHLARVELANNRSGSGASGASTAYSGGAGGAIMTNGGSVELLSSWVHDNYSGTGGSVSDMFVGFPGGGGTGGALASFGGSVGIELTSFDHNHSGDGGSGGMPGGGSAGFGGGIYANGGSLTVLLSSFDSNQTSTQPNGGSGNGGGVFVYSVATALTQASITRNIGYDGGGIGSGDSTVTLNDVTISGNGAGQFGGGLFVFGGTVTLDFITLSANQAALDSGGLRIEFGNSGAPNVYLRNSIVSGNSAPSQPDCYIFGAGTLTSLGYNVAGNGCPATGVGDVATTNPHLAALASNGGIGLTQMPAPGGPAVDAGSCLASGITADQRGNLRLVDVPRAPNAADACDIGAVELDDDTFWNGFQ